MKLNARDQLLLVIVLVACLWLAGIMYLIIPAKDKLKADKATLEEKITERDSKKAQVEKDKTLREDIQAAYDKAVETSSIFYPRMIQNAAATEMQSKFNVDGDEDEQEIKNTNLSVSEISSANLTQYVYGADAVNATLDELIQQVDGTEEGVVVSKRVFALTCYTFSYDFSATKEDCIKFMENLLSNDHKSLVLDSFEIASVGDNEDDTEWSGSMSLTLYMVPNLPTPEEVDARGKAALTDAEASNETVDAVEE